MTKQPGNHGNNAPRDGSPRVHSSAQLRDCVLGQFTDVAERVVMAECALGDYSYVERQAEAIYTDIGKFCAIAANARINALGHPMDRVSQHKITYRPNEYFLYAKVDKDFREARRTKRVSIGHDVWIGHGAIVMPGISIGHGAVVAAGAVVTKDVAAYEIVGGVPAKRIKWRFEKPIRERIEKLAWWDWPHDRLGFAVEDMKKLSPEEFLEKYSE
ncbi:DapH/DapD/GlmU-related protein [Aestuariivirga litoralis]|uniref:DapH/DapD/GlmU-related protein n=1 Tax=Aestuariivirga litoralis TaxID=2650924 RepID=UPI0018C83DEE|nr:DapH/DapD/GlmU-related protein [Aestuariivirga litoralis]MBG1233369.1 antibiotic acetyltransferase [Aestuariivirga litoralis]